MKLGIDVYLVVGVGKLQDRYGRSIDYLRFSITDRCNHRCFYCMSPGTKFLPTADLLTFQEMKFLVDVFKQLEIKQIRITGGEPLIREDVVQIVESLSKHFYLSMTTNGSMLKKLVKDLKAAGLSSINVSLNSLDEENFRAITFGELRPVLEGIDEAVEQSLFVKLNVVVSQKNFDELPELLKYASNRGVPIRFIEMMPVGRKNEGTVFEKQILEKLSSYQLKPVHARFGYGPAKYFVTKEGSYVGIISAMSNSFCESCNKLRLSCDGKLYPCLGSTFHVNLMRAIRSGQSTQQISELVRTAVNNKPFSHNMNHGKIDNAMNRLGG